MKFYIILLGHLGNIRTIKTQPQNYKYCFFFQNATFKKFNFRLRAKPDNYNDEVRVRHSIIGAEKVNYDNYNKMMAKELKENGLELPSGLDEYY